MHIMNSNQFGTITKMVKIHVSLYSKMVYIHIGIEIGIGIGIEIRLWKIFIFIFISSVGDVGNK